MDGYELRETRVNNDSEFYEIVKPISTGLASTLKNFLCGPSDREIYVRIKMYAMQLSHTQKMKILECVIELAKLNQLSDEKFRLLMIAFSG